jgi:2-polyprenyl-3-methyl-5-hydroxy-6-metoxy-1,4-benzoquinol methylase
VRSPAAVRSGPETLFQPVPRCWICDGSSLTPFHEYRFDFKEYAAQDPELDAYTGRTGCLVRCRSCGFAQPQEMPALPRFFDRMYDQRWSPEWVASEFDATCKDVIFRSILRELDRRVPRRPRRLLDIGAHAGRFLSLAQDAGWDSEGIELNPRTAAYARQRTGVPVHQVNAQALADTGARFHAITLTDVLEHIPEPVALIRHIARLLEPGGCLAVKVPCGRSQWFKERLLARVTRHEVSLAGNLVHVNHFTPHSLTLALERAGLKHVAVSAGAPELMPSDRPGVGRWMSNAMRLGAYAAAQIPGAVETPVTLNLQAYATT